MSHLPVDHPLRLPYRAMSLVLGVLMLVWGVIALVQTIGTPVFGPPGPRVLGLTANPGFAIIDIIFGIAVVIGAALGRNVDVKTNGVVAVVLILAGLVELMAIRTSLNYLAFSVTNVIISFILGLLLLTAALYGAVSDDPNPTTTRTKADLRAGSH